MDRTSRYARCEAPTRSCTLSTTAANGHSQRNKETGEPDDATSILSGSAGGWEKRPKGPRSQPTQLQSSRSTFSWGSFLSFFAFKEGMLSTPISVLGGWPTVSGRFVRQKQQILMLGVNVLRRWECGRLRWSPTHQELLDNITDKWNLSNADTIKLNQIFI